ncbi:MAG: DNA replication/repair protein RecF [Gammaproteobacteria bacterium]|nr:MAG: DNA replication/repair protein RecF [Gammaproteobacteria bacterium]
MPLKKLDVNGLRNLKPLQLNLSPTLNLFYGSNGSGKTSLLEAAFLLGRGRSFRNRQFQTVINTEQSECTVFGLSAAQGGREVPLGVTRYRQGNGVFKVAGQSVNTASSLADALPILLINQDGFNLLEGSPQHRRRFLDWGVFHVEHSYQQHYQRFQRILKQRNSLLRHGRIDDNLLATWDKEFADTARLITEARETYLQRLLPVLQEVLQELSPQLQLVSFSLYLGWDEDKSLSDVLIADRTRDQQFKTTHHGPHRADLRIRHERHNASDILSRGQLKILAVAMLIAQGYLYHEKTGKHGLYLIDDLAAELDLEHRILVARLLEKLGAQVFITGVEKQVLLGLWKQAIPKEMKLFHVEQGEITETPLNEPI